MSACRSSAKIPLFQTWLIRNGSKFKAEGKMSACRSSAKLFFTFASEILSQSVPDLNINIIGAGAVQTSKRVYKVVIGL